MTSITTSPLKGQRWVGGEEGYLVPVSIEASASDVDEIFVQCDVLDAEAYGLDEGTGDCSIYLSRTTALGLAFALMREALS